MSCVRVAPLGPESLLGVLASGRLFYSLLELDKEQFEGIVKFATILPQMNPEVAKKALEQFLEFEKSATELVSVMKDSTDKGMDANIASINSFDETCDTILEILREQLKEKEITPEQNNLSLRR